MNSYVLKFFLLFAVLASSPARAIIELSFDEAAKLALQDNPDLKTLHYQEESLKFKANQALAPLNPTVSYSKNNLSNLDTGAPPTSETYTLGFTIWFPGKSLAQSHQLENQALSLHEQSLTKEIDLLTSLSNNYTALLINRKTRRLMSDEMKRAKDVQQLSEKKYSVALVSQVDVLNSKVFIANLEHDLIVLEDEKQNLINQFLSIIKQPNSLDLVPKISDEVHIPKLERSIEDLTQLMLNNRPSLKSAQYQSMAAKNALHQAMLTPFPDFQLSVSANNYYISSASPVTDQKRDYSLGVTISLPIFFPFSELTGIRSAEKDHAAATAQEDFQRMNSILDLRSNYSKFQSSKRQTDNILTLVLPATKASYDLSIKAYALGRSDYLRLNDARQNWIAAQKDYLSHLAESAQLYNQIIQLVGCDLNNKESPHACL